MRLTKLFMITTGVLLTLVTIMLARYIFTDWRVFRSAESGLQSMELAYLAMKVAERASAERGPTIPVLNDTVPADPAKRARLTKAREASDAAFAAGLSGLAGANQPAERAALESLQKAKSQLAAARTEVDRVAALPFEERTQSGSTIRRAPIDKMFGVIDTTLDGVTQLTASALQTYPELAQPVDGARLGAILREYAGRLGSQFTGPLAAQKPITDDERNSIHALMGRIDQLHQLIEMDAHTSANDTRVKTAIAEMNARYFAVGLPLIKSLTAAGIAGSPYGMDSTQFVAKYVPEMASIISMRDAMFAVARTDANVRIEAAKRNLLINSLIGLALLLFEIGVFILIQKRVLKPLLASTKSVVDIAEGKLDSVNVRTARSDEIGDLQNALGALKQTSQSKQSLEREREALIEQLEAASTTDYLTQLLNRRGFTRLATERLTAATIDKQPIAVIIFDIDHFKTVNDRFGHTVGDQVLKQIAQIGQDVLYAEHCIARHGGEEFIAFLANCTRAEAEALSESLCNAVKAHPFKAMTSVFNVTISVGIATAQALENTSLDSLIVQADQALYQAKTGGRNRVVWLAERQAIRA